MSPFKTPAQLAQDREREAMRAAAQKEAGLQPKTRKHDNYHYALSAGLAAPRPSRSRIELGNRFTRAMGRGRLE